jgi:hypothetical protein
MANTGNKQAQQNLNELKSLQSSVSCMEWNVRSHASGQEAMSVATVSGEPQLALSSMRDAIRLTCGAAVAPAASSCRSPPSQPGRGT